MEFLWKYYAENMHQKLVADPFLILVNSPKQPLHARNCLKIRYFERGLSKSLKQVYFFSRTKPLLMDKLSKTKTCLELVTSCSSGYQTSSENFCYQLLPGQVWWNINQFLSYSKNYICTFMQAKPWHHKLFHFHLPFWIWKVWKGRKILKTKLNISRKKRAL